MDSKYVRQFKKGSLEMVLLCLISRKETYGYEILTELNSRGAQALGYAREGTVYPILYRLEAAGLIRCRTDAQAGRKYYSLTEKGREVLEERLRFWKEYTGWVSAFIEDCTEQEGS